MREQGCIVPYATRRQALNHVARYLSQFKKYPPGICRFCGCTEYNACTSKKGTGDPFGTCSWLDETETVCNGPYCIHEFNQWKDAQASAETL